MEEPWSLGSGKSLYKVLRVTVSGAFPPPGEPGFESQLGFWGSPLDSWLALDKPLGLAASVSSVGVTPVPTF